MTAAGRGLGPITCVGTPAFFGPRCDDEVSYRSPVGPLCASCAERSMEAIRRGGTLLNIIAAAKGIPVEELLSKYVRIKPEGATEPEEGSET